MIEFIPLDLRKNLGEENVIFFDNARLLKNFTVENSQQTNEAGKLVQR